MAALSDISEEDTDCSEEDFLAAFGIVITDSD